ncbi:DnaJ sub C member 21 [Phytophthora pseudosyringae]|uniref:DnaJ sub C member 21 n=1 Tax=Phytophthora pseudosyringae TaxID=221518 RepID=A0A8T1WH08_9STRA|nr:DnaJ sub C member 21 [Phytophthora pseudosyringae]
MAADQQYRRPGIGGMGMDGSMDEAAFPSTPYSAVQAQRAQMQMQFQQQIHQMQLQQSQPMDSIGPATSSLIHGGNTSAGVQMTSAPMQMASSPLHQVMRTRSSDAAATGSFVSALQPRPQPSAKRGGTVITGGDEPGMPQLYKTSKMRRPELWQFIRLVVPDPPHIAAGRTYTNQDAKEAYCLKCKRIMHYNTGSSNNVSRHMAKFHATDLASFAQKVADKKMKNKKQQDRSTYVQTTGAGASSSGSASPGAGHKRRRTETMTPNSEGHVASNITVQSPNGSPRLNLDELRATEDEGSKGELTQDETEQLNAIVARE